MRRKDEGVSDFAHQENGHSEAQSERDLGPNVGLEGEVVEVRDGSGVGAEGGVFTGEASSSESEFGSPSEEESG